MNDQYLTDLSRVLSIPEAFHLYGIPQTTLNDWCSEGKIAAAQLSDGRSWLISHGSLLDHMRKSGKSPRQLDLMVLRYMHQKFGVALKSQEKYMISVIVQIADFLLKASANYMETSEGQKEWNDIVEAVNPENDQPSEKSSASGKVVYS